MLSLWLLASLAASAVYALTAFIDKVVVSKLLEYRHYYVFWGIAYLLVGLPIPLFLPVRFEPVLALALLAGVVRATGIFFYAKALGEEEVSRVITIVYSNVIFVAILAAVFLGEVLSVQKYLGIALLLSGAMLVSLRGSLTLRRGALHALACAVFLAMDAILIRYLTAMGYPFWLVFFWFVLSIGISNLFIARNFIGEALGALSRLKRTELAAITVSNVLLYPLGLLLVVYAFSLADAPLVAAVLSTEPMFLLLFTTAASLFIPRLLREELEKGRVLVKIAAAALVILGVYLVS